MWIPCSLIFSSFVKSVYTFVLVYLNFQVPLAPISLFIPSLNNLLVFTGPTYCLRSNLWEILLFFLSLLNYIISIHQHVCALFSALAHTFSPQTYNITCSPFFPSLMLRSHLLIGQSLATSGFLKRAQGTDSVTVFLKAILAKYKFLGSANYKLALATCLYKD